MDTRLADLAVDVAEIDRRSAAASRKARVVRVRITNDEDRWLTAAAAARGVTVSVFLRSVLGAARRSMS